MLSKAQIIISIITAILIIIYICTLNQPYMMMLLHGNIVDWIGATFLLLLTPLLCALHNISDTLDDTHE